MAGEALKNEPLHGRNLLIVEDCPDSRFLLRRYLEGRGAQVVTADDGREGVTQALDGTFDLVVMDLRMPNVDGHEAMQQLKDQGYTKPVIALSAHVVAAERQRCAKEGFRGFLTKPITQSKLVTAIQDVLSGSDWTSE